jgi:hypothetical protein
VYNPWHSNTALGTRTARAGGQYWELSQLRLKQNRTALRAHRCERSTTSHWPRQVPDCARVDPEAIPPCSPTRQSSALAASSRSGSALNSEHGWDARRRRASDLERCLLLGTARFAAVNEAPWQPSAKSPHSARVPKSSHRATEPAAPDPLKTSSGAVLAVTSAQARAVWACLSGYSAVDR